MDDWKNIDVISCVDRAGLPVTVIEQSREERARLSVLTSGRDAFKRRLVLGNGARVKSLDPERFVLIETHEVVTRL